MLPLLSNQWIWVPHLDILENQDPMLHFPNLGSSQIQFFHTSHTSKSLKKYQFRYLILSWILISRTSYLCHIYCKMYVYLSRTFKTTLLLWTLGKCTLIWAASKRSIFAILVLITRFISRSSKCFSIRTTSIPIKIFLLISSSFKFLVPCFSEACRYHR